MYKKNLIVVFVIWAGCLWAQKPITLDGIWGTYAYYAQSVDGFVFRNDGKSYTLLEEGKLRQYDVTTGQPTATLFDMKSEASYFEGLGITGLDGYQFSPDEKQVLFSYGTDYIYRRSFTANYILYHLETKKLTPVNKSLPVRDISFSPAGDKLAWVSDNNLYINDLASGSITQVTTDGQKNAIINGAADWVYEEEFGITRMYEWSPDGKFVAYVRFDETEVPEFTMQMFRYRIPDAAPKASAGKPAVRPKSNDDMYPENVTFKYPKVGEKNSKATLHLFDVTKGKSSRSTIFVDEYIPRIKWQSNDWLCAFVMDRQQRTLNLKMVNAVTGGEATMLTEVSKYYVDIHDNLTFLPDNRFLWTSETVDGFNHIYLYQWDPKQNRASLVRKLTSGKGEVTAFYGYDPKRNLVYYQAAVPDPMHRRIYAKSINDDSEPREIVADGGWNDVQFSPTFDFLSLTSSTANHPPVYSVANNAGQRIRVIEDNAGIVTMQQDARTVPVEFFSFKTPEGTELNGWMMKPAKMKRKGKYPIFMTLYGGPGSQEVTDRWMGQDYWWHQMLVQKGYVVVCVDNRGTGARGEEFKKCTQLRLGDLETQDQIAAARWLGTQPWADASRIGIFGWSYGGFMSTNCILKGNDIFKTAIAVAPVTNWKWYDNIYTERFMDTETNNPTGYELNSPVNYAHLLKGNYLLIHGIADDNVHYQHSAEMMRALVKNNRPFRSQLYPNCNHGIYGGSTRLHLYTLMTDYLYEKL